MGPKQNEDGRKDRKGISGGYGGPGASQLLSASETVLKTAVAQVWPCLCDYLEIELAVITSLAEDSLQHCVCA